MNISDQNSKPEVIDLEGIWYRGGFGFKLEKDKTGSVHDNFEHDICPIISDHKLIKFWNNIEKLGVWNWHKKYPYWKQKYEPLTDGCSWQLKLRNREGKVKFCKGYESFPRNFKKLINELNQLFESNVEWR